MPLILKINNNKTDWKPLIETIPTRSHFLNRTISKSPILNRFINHNESID